MDAGEIKAVVKIEYDGSGIQKAKEDLASLAESAGGVGESAGTASEGLAGLDEQLGKNAGSAKSFTSAISELPKIVESGEASVANMTGVMEEHQQAIEGIASGYEALQKPISETTAVLQESSSFMPHYAENLSAMGDAWGTAGNNMQVFQEALASPDSFQTIYDHLDKTGQSIEEFTSSIGESNAQLFHEMSIGSAQTSAWIDTGSAGFENLGTKAKEGFGSVVSSAGEANKAVEEFMGAGVSAAKSSGLGGMLSETFSGIGGMLNDIAMPLMAVQMIGQTMGMVAQFAGQAFQGMYDMATIVEGPASHSVGSFTGTVDALGESIQKVGGQFSESFGRQIIPTLNAANYEMAQSVDSSKDLGGQLGGWTSFLTNVGLIGAGLETATLAPETLPLDLEMIKVGGMGLINQGASMFGLPQPFEGPGPTSGNAMQQQIDAYYAQANNPQLLAAQAYYSSASGKAMQAQQSWDVSHYTGSTGPTDPMNQVFQMQAALQYGGPGSYGSFQDPNLAWTRNLGLPSESLPFGSSVGGGMRYTGTQPPSTPFDGLFNTIGNITGGIDDWFSNLIPGFSGGGGADFSGSGCFVAGTRVRMADGTEKAIETLQIGEKVLACDGGKQITTTILALITPPPKRVYKLTFSDGQTLTLTDSHPVATTEGWKALSVEHAKQENPDLSVTALQIGDSVCTTYGACTLTSILPLQGVRQIYNITVDAPHTFYAGGILVHNKMLNSEIGPQVSEQIGGIQLPHIDLSGMSAQLAGSFGGIQLPHIDLSGIASGLGGAFSGITLPHIDLSSMTAGLSSMFSGISLPAMPDIGGQINGALGGMFSGISLPAIPDIGGQIGGALSGMFGGISLPAIPDIGGMLSGALSGMFGGISLPSIPDIGSMISGAMGGMFGGIEVPHPPDIGAMISGAMTGMFGGIQIPSPPNLGAQISSAMSGMFSGISLPSVPFFAEGVEGFGGGLAMVGERGPELVSLPSGSSVYPLTTGSGVGGSVSPISLGGGGGGNMPQSINVSVHLDSQAILSAIGMPFAQNIWLASGMRGF